MNTYQWSLGNAARYIEELSTDLKVAGFMVYGLVWFIIFHIAS